VAYNSGTPQEVLLGLALDTEISLSLAENPNASAAVLTQVASAVLSDTFEESYYDERSDILATIFHHPHAPPELRQALESFVDDD
jgi:hypothetical protein